MKVYVFSIFIAIALGAVLVGCAETWGEERFCNSRYAVYYDVTDKCYCLNKKNKTWEDARAFCKAGGGDLAVIVDATLNGKLKALADRWCGNDTLWDVWFGLRGRHGTPPVRFDWVAGRDPIVEPLNDASNGYTNFFDNAAGISKCFCLVSNGQWYQFSCHQRLPFFCESDAPTSICCDPHFMVHVQGMSEPVCFDYYGDDKDILQLVYGPQDGLVVNGAIFTHGHTRRSWFGALSFMVPGCEITASIEGFTIEGKKHDWESMDHQNCGSTSVTFSLDADSSTRAAHLVIHVRPGVQFIFSRDHKEYKFGDIIYMNFEMGEHYGLDETTNGLLGQFMGMKIKLDEESYDDDTHKATLSFPDEPWRDSITAKSVSRKILYTHKHIHCWNVENEGEGLVRGTARDYLVPDLLTNKQA